MSQPYIGEIRMVGFSFAPAGWAFCSGQLVPISENDALFNLIGTTYGGDGQETFGLPNLQGRVPMHQGTGSFGTTYQMGEQAGVESVTLTISQIPNHTHPVLATTDAGNANLAGGNFLGSGQVIYAPAPASHAMNALMDSAVGGSQPHENMQPFLTINFVISLFGIFPTQT
jgi:microcystin-dependent protein